MSRDETRSIPIGQLHRSISTPRENHDEAALERLAHWIRRRGVLQPILVRSLGKNMFEVVAGERRYLAAQRAGLTELECRVREYPDQPQTDEPCGDVYALEDALIENLVREDLGKLEESEAILDLICLHVGEDRGFVLERLGAMHGRAIKRKTPVNACLEDDQILEVFIALNLIGWRAFYTHRAPLLRLPDQVKRLLFEHRISYVAASRIARLEESEQQTIIARVRQGELRGTALNLELDRCLKGTQTGFSSRLARLQHVLPKQLNKPQVQRKLKALERELGLT
jgi:ParB family transcriptional regulator, chromosome partitioning protein